MANVESGMAFLYQGLAGLAGLTPEGAAGAQQLGAQAQSEAAADTRKRQREADRRARRAGIGGTIGALAGSMLPIPGGAAIGAGLGAAAGGASGTQAATAALSNIQASDLRSAVGALGGGSTAASPSAPEGLIEGAGEIKTSAPLGGTGQQTAAQNLAGRMVQRAMRPITEELETRRTRREAYEEAKGGIGRELGPSALEPPPGSPASRVWDFLERHDDSIMSAVQALAGGAGATAPSVTPHSLLDPQTASAMEGERMQREQLDQQRWFQERQLDQGDRRIDLEGERVAQGAEQLEISRDDQSIRAMVADAQLELQREGLDFDREKFGHEMALRVNDQIRQGQILQLNQEQVAHQIDIDNRRLVLDEKTRAIVASTAQMNARTQRMLADARLNLAVEGAERLVADLGIPESVLADMWSKSTDDVIGVNPDVLRNRALGYFSTQGYTGDELVAAMSRFDAWVGDVMSIPPAGMEASQQGDGDPENDPAPPPAPDRTIDTSSLGRPVSESPAYISGQR